MIGMMMSTQQTVVMEQQMVNPNLMRVKASHKRNRSITLEIKSLNEKKAKQEKGILKLTGAAKLAQEQFSSIVKSGTCSLCNRHANASPETVQRMKKMFALCDESRNRYVANHRACLDELAQLLGKTQIDSAKEYMKSDEWCSMEFKKGKITTLRQQKVESLKTQKCVGCGTPISDLQEFLVTIDRQIRILENSLHVHN